MMAHGQNIVYQSLCIALEAPKCANMVGKVLSMHNLHMENVGVFDLTGCQVSMDIWNNGQFIGKVGIWFAVLPRGTPTMTEISYKSVKSKSWDEHEEEGYICRIFNGYYELFEAAFFVARGILAYEDKMFSRQTNSSEPAFNQVQAFTQAQVPVPVPAQAPAPAPVPAQVQAPAPVPAPAQVQVRVEAKEEVRVEAKEEVRVEAKEEGEEEEEEEEDEEDEEEEEEDEEDKEDQDQDDISEQTMNLSGPSRYERRRFRYHPKKFVEMLLTCTNNACYRTSVLAKKNLEALQSGQVINVSSYLLETEEDFDMLFLDMIVSNNKLHQGLDKFLKENNLVLTTIHVNKVLIHSPDVLIRVR